MNSLNRFYSLLVLYLLSFDVYCQEINCYNANIDVNNCELLKIIEEYNLDNLEKLLLIDYKKSDSINIYRVVGSIQWYEIFFKKPDCYLKHQNIIAYIYTENYYYLKDSIWLSQVFNETLNLFDISNAVVSWENDSIIKIGNVLVKVISYDPIIYEYHVYNGKILKKIIKPDMIYPSISYPKGIRIFREQ